MNHHQYDKKQDYYSNTNNYYFENRHYHQPKPIRKPKSHKDIKMMNATTCRVDAVNVPHYFHAKRHELRIAVDRALKMIQEDDDHADIGIEKFVHVKNDQCLIKPNNLTPEETGEKPNFREFGTLITLSNLKQNPGKLVTTIKNTNLILKIQTS